MSDLRDMDVECEHGVDGPHRTYWEGWDEAFEDCPGGRDVAFDWEAANKEATTMYPLSPRKVRRIVTAAIGDTDEP